MLLLAQFLNFVLWKVSSLLTLLTFNLFSFHNLHHAVSANDIDLFGSADRLPVFRLSGALGHYDAGFTLSTYTHATEGMKRDAADAIGSVISQTM